MVKAYSVDRAGTLVVVIPKEVREELGIEKGKKFTVKIDTDGRIVYEPVK